MASGKRLSTAEPLTEHDVAERLDRAAVRTLHILMDARQIDGLMDLVQHSRYLTNSLGMLAAELEAWGIRPQPGHDGIRDPGTPGDFEVLGQDFSATCLAHHRTVCWLPAPAWWVHNPPGDGTAECSGMRNAPAPIVLVRKENHD